MLLSLLSSLERDAGGAVIPNTQFSWGGCAATYASGRKKNHVFGE